MFFASNDLSATVCSFISKQHELARVDLTDVMRLHVVGEEIFSRVVNMCSDDFVLRSSESVHSNIESILRGARSVNTNEIGLHSDFRFSLFYHNSVFI